MGVHKEVPLEGAGFLERQFKLKANGTTVRTEVAAGITTFMTMAYIVVVNPSIVSATGMSLEGVMVATAVSAAIATLLMAFFANYPFALAPGMGLNAYFTYVLVLGHGYPWQTALGAVFVSGVLFLLLTLTGAREAVINAVPPSLKSAIAAGIGLFLAFIGLSNAGFVVSDPATFVALGDLRSPETVLAAVGLLVTAALMANRVRGAILLGILVTYLVGLPFGITSLPKKFILQAPNFSAWSEVLFKADIGAAFNLGFTSIAGFMLLIFTFFFVDLFDTVGTLIGVSKQGGFLDKDGRLPKARQALLADSVGTIAGSLSGTPTVTSYIESASGVAAGGRTGLVGLVVAAGFILTLFFGPLVEALAEVLAVTAPALIIVGSLMVKPVIDVAWDDASEAIPAFIAIVMMPLAYSIAHGIALAFIAYPIVKLASKKGREVSPALYVLAIIFILMYALR